MSSEIQEEGQTWTEDVKFYLPSSRKIKKFPVYGGLTSSYSTNSSILDFLISSDGSADISTHLFHLLVSGYNKKCFEVNQICNYIEISIGNTVVQTFYHYDQINALLEVVSSNPSEDYINMYGQKNELENPFISQRKKAEVLRKLRKPQVSGLDANSNYLGKDVNLIAKPPVDRADGTLTNPADVAAAAAFYDRVLRELNANAIDPSIVDSRYGAMGHYYVTDDGNNSTFSSDGIRQLNYGRGLTQNGPVAVEDLVDANSTNKQWITLKFKNVPFLNLKKYLPLRLMGTIKIRLGINQRPERTLKPITGLAISNYPAGAGAYPPTPKIRIHDAVLTLDIITFPEQYWSMMLNKMQNGGITIPIENFSTFNGRLQTGNLQSYVLNEKKLWLNYALFVKYNEADTNADPLKFRYVAPYNHTIQSRDVMTFYPQGKTEKYEVKINSESMTDGYITTYSEEQPLVSLGYLELLKVMKLKYEGPKSELFVPPILNSEWQTDKNILACSFVTGDTFLNDNIIDATDNTQRSSMITFNLQERRELTDGEAVRIKADNYPTHYFALVSFTTVIKIKPNGEVVLIS